MPIDTLRVARASAAIELRLAASLRRDYVAGRFYRSQRSAVISAIRDHLRHARFCNQAAGGRLG